MATQPPFKLTIGYRSYMMTATDAAKVMDMLVSAPCIDSTWLGGRGASVNHYVEPQSLSLEQVSGPVLTLSQFEAAEAEDRALRDAKAAKEADAA